MSYRFNFSDRSLIAILLYLYAMAVLSSMNTLVKFILKYVLKMVAHENEKSKPTF